jgi:hypothetical protein
MVCLRVCSTPDELNSKVSSSETCPDAERSLARDPGVMVRSLVVRMKQRCISRWISLWISLWIVPQAVGKNSSVGWVNTPAPVRLTGRPQPWASVVFHVKHFHGIRLGTIWHPKPYFRRRSAVFGGFDVRSTFSSMAHRRKRKSAPGPTQARLHCRLRLCSNSHFHRQKIFMWITLWISSVEN